ncbi:hypothetical protein ACFQV2_13705 [Actinokineospora soli]|uniref:Uncharacterized protein n=1 Tax=Actinokineospora soli TaxID=1048753 RepID=A0ABW2TNN9_9PSEU
MRTTPETVDLHWVHTLAYLFAGENGGDITDPTVNNAAQVGLKRCESFLNDLRGSARLRSDTHATLLSHLSTVTRALHAAGRPGVLHQAQTCGCGTFKGRPPAQEPAPRQPDDEQQELIRDAAVAVAERDPAADAWIDDALAQPGPAQLLYYAACLLADFTTTADGPVGSPTNTSRPRPSTPSSPPPPTKTPPPPRKPSTASTTPTPPATATANASSCTAPSPPSAESCSPARPRSPAPSTPTAAATSPTPPRGERPRAR